MSPLPTSTRTSTILLGVVATIMVGWVLRVGAEILQPLVIALLLASMLQPVVRQAARWKIPPPLTVVLILTLFFTGMVRVGILVQSNLFAFFGDSASPAIGPFENVQGEASAKLGGWDGLVNRIQDRLSSSSAPEAVVEYATEFLRENEKNVQDLATDFIGSGFDFTKGLLLVSIYMVFIFLEQAVFRRKILAIAGDRREVAEDVLDSFGRGIQRYLGVKTVISLVTAGLCYAMLVALDIPYALLFGFLTFLLNYIPTFGSIIAALFPTVTALAIDPTWNKPIIVMLTYLTVNITLGSFLEPRILGRTLKLSPLVIVISVVFWGGLWGIVGAFLSVPLTAAAQIILDSHENTRSIAVLLSSGPPKETRRDRKMRAAGQAPSQDRGPRQAG